MRLLDRYLLRQLLVPLGYCLSGFLIFWIAGDLFNHLSEYQAKHLHAPDVAEYYLVKTPEFLGLVMPIALLLGLLYALTNHARHNELTAIRAAGVSLWRVCAAYLLVGFSFSLVSFGLNEFWIPGASDLAEQILARRSAITVAAADQDAQTNAHFKNARDHRIWEIDRYDFATHVMQGPKVTTILPDGASWWLIAARAEQTNGVWAFFDVERFDVAPRPGSEPRPTLKTNYLVVPEFSETPDRIDKELRINRRLSARAWRSTELSIKEILDYLDLHRDDLTPRDSSWLRTQFQGHFAAPWTCLVVVLIAIPYAARSGRRNVLAGAASGIVICFAYFVLLRVGLALGTGGLIPPWAGAWLPNLTFGLAGCWMMLRAS